MGVTPKQLILCLLIIKRQGVITSYKELSQLSLLLFNIETTPVAVRERIKSLKKIGVFSECIRKNKGSNQGMSLKFNDSICNSWFSLDSKCSGSVAYLPQSPPSPLPTSLTHAHPHSQPQPMPQPSLLLNKKEEEYNFANLRNKDVEQNGKEKLKC